MYNWCERTFFSEFRIESQKSDSLHVVLTPVFIYVALFHPEAFLSHNLLVSLCLTRMVHDLDVKVLMLSQFGRNLPKQHKLSPDAFVQMSLQLAYFR